MIYPSCIQCIPLSKNLRLIILVFFLSTYPMYFSVAHIAMFTSDTCRDVVGQGVWDRLGLSSEGFSLIHMRAMVLADKNPTKLSHIDGVNEVNIPAQWSIWVMGFWGGTPETHKHKKLQKDPPGHHAIYGKTHELSHWPFSKAMFIYQRVNPIKSHSTTIFLWFSYGFRMDSIQHHGFSRGYLQVFSRLHPPRDMINL